VNTKQLEYKLPKELIADSPAVPRDSARLIIYDSQLKQLIEDNFRHLGNYLKKGDVIVFNKTKVFPARIYGTDSKGKHREVLFLSEIKPRVWEVLIRGKVIPGELLLFSKKFQGRVIAGKNYLIKVNLKKAEVFSELEKIGKIPLPPYIKRELKSSDKKNYQTVFANEIGSAAAPTASMHFTKRLISSLKNYGIQIEFVTLHVGLGTFAPIKTEQIESHPIHSEHIEVDILTAERLNNAKRSGARIIACGTTVLRTLESVCETRRLKSFKGETKLFIYPGYKFHFVDGLITNFHTPKSSLLALVFAFAGEKNIRMIYKKAIQKKYRFFSYGDGMLLLP